MTDVAKLIATLTREVPDFPEPGVQFKDLTPLLADRHGLAAVLRPDDRPAAVTGALAEVAAGADLIAGIDARGFLLGAAVATKLGTGVLAIRKGGKLPPPVRREEYVLEYGTAVLEIPAEGIDLTGLNIVVIDDVLATGGTLAAARKLLVDGGAQVAAGAVVLELTDLGGREVVAPLPVTSLRTI